MLQIIGLDPAECLRVPGLISEFKKVNPGHLLHLEISSHSAAILLVILPVLPLHILLLAQHLAVEEPRRGDEVEQQYPVGEDQELAQEDEGESGVDRVAAEGEHPRGHERTGRGGIDPHPEAAPEGNQAPREPRKTQKAKQHPQPTQRRGFEEHSLDGRGPAEGMREDQVEVEQGEGRDEEIGAVQLAELHGRYPAPSQQDHPRDHHPQHDHDRESTRYGLHVFIPYNHPNNRLIK